jgi:YD repeat-containing protein
LKVLKCSVGGCGSGQVHSDTYDSLGRLVTASTQESGTYTYNYTSSSGALQLALQSRLDPRGYTTTYTYDAGDRLTAITYNDGTPSGSYSYDYVGNLTQSSNAHVTNNYLTFDGDNRVTSSSVSVAAVTYNFSYQYDLAGDLTKETYPSGRQVSYDYDAAFRPLDASGVSAGVTTNYVQSAGYFPHGAPQFWQYGNNLYNWQSVNKMLASQEVWATQNNDGNKWMFIAYNGYDNSENVIAQTEGFGPGVPWNNMTFLTGAWSPTRIKTWWRATTSSPSAKKYPTAPPAEWAISLTPRTSPRPSPARKKTAATPCCITSTQGISAARLAASGSLIRGMPGRS